jgi:hypothetical protein
MEIDGKLPPLLLGYWFRPIAPAHTAQSGICVRRMKPDVYGARFGWF